MSKSLSKRAFLTLALALTLAVTGLLATATSASAAGECQCTTYVANVFGLSGYPAAKYWGSYLAGRGWSADSGIHVNDIIVMQPSSGLYVTTTDGRRFWWYADSVSGHVAYVKSAAYHQNGTWTVTLRGANNHTTPLITSSGCTNVSDLSFVSGGSGGGVAFYH